MAKLFKEGKMASNHLDTYLAGVKAPEGGLDDGELVVLGDLVADTTYAASGDYEYDVYECEAPTEEKLADAIIDMADVNEVASGLDYAAYKMGRKLYNLHAEEGKIVRARRLALHDKFWLGEGNFESTPSVGDTISVAVGDIKVLLGKDLTTGQRANGKIYLCEVVAKAEASADEQ